MAFTTTTSDTSFNYPMLEADVEYPSKYSESGAIAQSMIKQTAEEILMQVSDTYIKVGDGNITLNGDTQVNGSLTIDDEQTGFILKGDSGITEIMPKSIGTYSDFASGTTVTQYDGGNSTIFGYETLNSMVSFYWTMRKKLGKFKSGSYININNFEVAFVAVNATNGGAFATPTITFYIQEGGTTKKKVSYKTTKKDSILANYQIASDSEVSVIVTIEASAPLSNWENRTTKTDSSKLTPIPNPEAKATYKWEYVLPTDGSYTLIGYDGIGINFGTSNNFYVGNEGMHVKYGGYELIVNSNGIYGLNRRNTNVISGTSGTADSPITYTFLSSSDGSIYDITDTILMTANYGMVVFPYYPYEGQEIKVIDKCTSEGYINPNGKTVVACNGTNTKTTKFSLDGRVPRLYTYIGGNWYEEINY